MKISEEIHQINYDGSVWYLIHSYDITFVDHKETQHTKRNLVHEAKA